MRSSSTLRIGLGALVLLAALALSPGWVWAAGESGPRQTVEKLHAALLEAMTRAAELGYQGRYDLLQPVVRETYDLPTLARVVLGRHWAGLEGQQQSDFLQAFEQFSVATYASRFDGYAGERFETRAEQPLEHGDVAVRTALVKSDGSLVTLDYVVHQVEGGWRIVNVVADGVSELATRRAEYGSIIKQSGFERLLASIREKVAAYASGGG